MSAPHKSMDDVVVETGVPARMRDGVTLRAEVYRPRGEGPWPVLLTRSPYGADDIDVVRWLDLVATARRGFILVVQDTRGRYTSDGEWMPLRYEREDGYDTVEWAARLPGADGRVCMFGTSYVGSTQWMAAVERPPSLVAIAPALTWCEPLEGLLARGGAVELGLALAWSLLASAAHLPRMPLSEEELGRRFAALIEDYDGLADAGYRELPVGEQMAVLRRTGAPELGSLRALRDPGTADWSRVAGRHERVTVPTLHIGAWNDVFLQGTLDNYTAMAALGRPAQLLVGPWTHTLPFVDPIGERCFGIGATAHGVPLHADGDLRDVQVAWFERQLGGETASVAPVRIFVMGRNEWRDEQAWPLTRARAQRWYLGAGGTLGPDVPAPEAAASEYAYDPEDPVPTLGGQMLMTAAFPPGPHDQAPVEARADVLVFTSEPLREDLEVTGPVRVVLHAESSAPSTDWVARLCDVHPDGRSFNLCDGIVRVAEGADACRQVEIDLWSTSNVFLAGHRLRVHVTSSSFPRWDRNLNTGDQHEARVAIARQRVRHDAQRPSWIELPVIPH